MNSLLGYNAAHALQLKTCWICFRFEEAGRIREWWGQVVANPDGGLWEGCTASEERV